MASFLLARLSFWSFPAEKLLANVCTAKQSMQYDKYVIGEEVWADLEDQTDNYRHATCKEW